MLEFCRSATLKLLVSISKALEFKHGFAYVWRFYMLWSNTNAFQISQKSAWKLYLDLANRSHVSHHHVSLSSPQILPSTHTPPPHNTAVCAALSSAPPTHGAILKSKLTKEDIRTSPGCGERRQKVQSAGRTDTGRLDPHPGPANRSTAATLAKCIPWAAVPNPCLTLADKLCYG